MSVLVYPLNALVHDLRYRYSTTTNNINIIFSTTTPTNSIIKITHQSGIQDIEAHSGHSLLKIYNNTLIGN